MKPDYFSKSGRNIFKTLFLLSLISSIPLGHGATVFGAEAVPARHFLPPVPEELITGDSTFWTITAFSRLRNRNSGTVAAYNSNKTSGGMTAKFKFTRDGRFLFLQYAQTNKRGVNKETRTELEGDVDFIRNSKGQPVMITRAKKGVYRIIENGKMTSTDIPKNELESQHSSTYFWEITMVGNDDRNLYLLLVDLEKHPRADADHPSTIDPAWISIFHIPVKN